MISVIIATLNEEKGIKHVLNKIPRDVDGEKVESIVVDGLSTDSTVKIAKENGARIVFERRRGKGFAMMTGVRNARGDKLVFIDGDGEYDSSMIPLMIKLLKNCNMVVASRFFPKIESCDFIANSFFQVARLTLGYLRKHYKIPHYFETSEPWAGLRAIRKRDWKKLKIESPDFRIEVEMEMKAIKHHFKIIEIPHPRLRRYGKSKLTYSLNNWKKIFKYVKENSKTFSKKPKVYRVIDYSI